MTTRCRSLIFTFFLAIETDTDTDEAQSSRSQQKRSGRNKKGQDTRNANFVANPCPHCGSTSHRSSRSPDCPAYNRSTETILKDALGSNLERFCRKCSFDRGIREPFVNILRQNVITLARYQRSVVVKAQIFVNYYILIQDGPIPQACFTQNFWYSVMQLVMGGIVTTSSDKLPDDLISSWQDFKSNFPLAELTAEEKQARPRRISSLNDACVLLATNYSNHIVENFASRIIAYMKRKLSQVFPVSILVI
jgi:hypothetical protein